MSGAASSGVFHVKQFYSNREKSIIPTAWPWPTRGQRPAGPCQVYPTLSHIPDMAREVESASGHAGQSRERRNNPEYGQHETLDHDLAIF